MHRLKRNQRGIHLNNLADILIIIVCRLTDYSKEPLVDARADAEEGDACRADGEGKAGVAIRLEGGQRSLCLIDIHSLDDEQVVVE